MNWTGPLWWPLARLGEALELLAVRSGLSAGAAQALGAPDPQAADPVREARRWIDWAGEQLGVDVAPIEVAIPDLPLLLAHAAPAVLPYADERGLGFFLLVGRARLLAADGRTQRVPAGELRDALCRHREAPLLPEVDAVLAVAEVPARRREPVRRALLADRLAGERVGPCWMLRLPPGAPVRRQLADAALPRRLLLALVLFAAGYALEIAGWAVVGEGTLQGRLDIGGLVAWALLLATLLPLRLGGAWLQSSFVLDAGRLLKSRLLAGALRLDADRMRALGVGQWLGRVIESQALEAMTLSGGLTTLVALLELGFAAAVLSFGAAAAPHLALLAAALGATALLGWRHVRRLRAWTLQRLALTDELVEAMVGHRTRLAQDPPDRRDAHDDRRLQAYAQVSAAMDGAAVPLFGGLPALWTLLALAALVPAFADGIADVAPWAVSLGGVLLARRALGGLGSGMAGLARAAIAWQQVRELFAAGATPAPTARPFVPAHAPAADQPLVDAAGLAWRYGDGPPVLAGADLRIAPGERLLLEGPSGGGKSTLAALVAGLRAPQSGLLLLDGLDRATLGDDWQRLASAAPQFHENHVFGGTLAFNLLMGRAWPAAEADLAEAEALCRALGLGDLLARMPAGLQQRVGETGWQLSHGERSRVFLARALLQRAPLTVLDESFAALDPETLRTCLQATLARSDALLVIAHP